MSMEDNKNTEQSITGNRCAINKNLDKDVRIIASQLNKTKCEVVEDAVGYYIERNKIRA
ncbi:MAG: hypothetical protein WBZ36_04810 [Candidatus Nitrosopolaris sp.]